MKVKVQKEAFVNTILEQSFVIEVLIFFLSCYSFFILSFLLIIFLQFFITNEFCPDCHKQATPNTWTAVVQARQKVSHKRTFLYLEQVILKYNMQSQCLKIKGFFIHLFIIIALLLLFPSKTKYTSQPPTNNNKTIEFPNGLDFYFAKKSHAIKFTEVFNLI